ncbi:flagellar hook-associated protein FlgK [Shewanella ulleungensis]|uniref:Flagellar hook-associated protein 1 n=1 Tax=Shewanella ulleungensis TaxID=2282699 RepID=A0ABQ2QIY3_9GAMM|nr:flagellar hook-associated protein FlgK [Shewanella ulleungensis]MCL1149832.1 flagellar hook-associated protein FlgK [Shewanella ulleungensis]GGP81634.1 flagellar hook-associated protein FlgK [Shewanella ulleungensis]
MAIDLLSIARTGVMASQSQLGVTGNNIANANTEGYNRQTATQATLQSQRLGDSFYGTGTYVSDVKRVYNEFAARELRIGQTSMSAAETTYSKLSELDELYAQVGSMVPNSINDFFASINSVADLPTDLGIRSNSLSSAEQMAININQMQSQLDNQVKQTNSQIESVTTRVNEISKELANINLELMKSQGDNNEILDKQDALILELSEYAQVNVIPLDTGAKSIMLGGSVMLVSGEVAMSMGVGAGDPFPNEPTLTASISNKTLNVDPSKLGGQLGALFAYRDDTLIPASNELGQLALGVADTFNEMQSSGFDLNGEVGSDIFRDINSSLMSSGRAGSYSTNTSSAALSVNIDDVGALSGSSYELSFTTAGGYALKDNQTGEVSTLTLSGTELTSSAGFTINVANGPIADGDKFEIRPTAGAASGLKVVMTDPKGITAAGPTLTAATANSGNTSISLNSMDSSVAGFPGSATGSSITFTINTVANTYQAFDSAGASLGTGTITNNNINAFGIDFDISTSGTATADSFTFDLAFAEGNNSNAVEMASLSDVKLMNNGTGTLTSVFENTKLDIGSQTKAAEVRVDSATAIYQQAYDRVQSESGVNLDEEAANLLRFQQSYQAAARIMSTAQTIFDTLLSSVR